MNICRVNFWSGKRLNPLPSMAAATLFVIVAIAHAFGTAECFAQAAKPKIQQAANAITEEEAEEFAQSLAEAVRNGDLDQTNQLYSWDDTVDRATLLPKLPELKESRNTFKKSVVESLQKPAGLFGTIIDLVKKGGSYCSVRINVSDKEPFVLFRLKYPNNGPLNYHKLYLKRRPNGEVFAEDMYVLLSAERMSDTLHRSWMELATQSARKKDNAVIKNFEAFQNASIKISGLAKDGKNAEALAEFQKSPESVKKDKNILMIVLVAAQKVSDEEYGKTLNLFRKSFPNDPAIDFLSVDYYFLRDDFDQTLACVNRTIERLGEDSALLGMRANLLVKLNKLPEAVEAAKAAMASEPDLADPYVAALDVLLAAKDHDETLAVLKTLRQKFRIQFKDLREVPVFAEFVKSPQFQEWVESRDK